MAVAGMAAVVVVAALAPQHFPDMRTAFPLKLELPDLSYDDMAGLITRTATARGYRMESTVQAQLPRIIRDSHTSADARAYNSILAGGVLSKAIQAQAARCGGWVGLGWVGLGVCVCWVLYW